MNKRDSGNGSLNEYSIKSKLTEKLTSISIKNKFIKDKLSNKHTVINETQIQNNLSDISSLISQINTLLSNLQALINKKEDNEKLQLIYQLHNNQLLNEKQAYALNLKSFDEFILSSQAQNHNEDETFNNDNYNRQITEDDIKYSKHTSDCQGQIDEIYEKTRAINQLSKDMNSITHSQEHQIETIESNLLSIRSNAHKGNQELSNKIKEKALKNSTNCYTITFVILLCVFILLFYMQLIR